MNLLYLSDVFCPWCYGFGPVMRRILSDHPEFSVRVLGGDLMEEPESVKEMRDNYPTIRAFFERLGKTTGQPVDKFIALMDNVDQGDNWIMHSPEMGVPLVALKTLAPGHELDQMEAFQRAFYGEARDVLSREVQHELAARWHVEADAFDAACADPAIQSRAAAEAAEASDIMGEFRLYPTLYLEKDDGSRELLARGYAVLETVQGKLDAALAGARPDFAQGACCGLDGKCCC